MKWGRKKNPVKIQESDIVHEHNAIKKPSFSLSNLFPWLSKLKHPKKPNNINHSPKPTTAFAPTPAPTPKSLLSPPRLPATRTYSDVAAPRRFSVGDDDSHLARSRARARARSLPHHHSLGSASELDLLLLDPLRVRHRRRRSRRHRPSAAEIHPDLKPIKTGPSPGPGPGSDPIRSGRRSFSGGRGIRPRVRVYSPRLANPNTIAKEKGGALERFAVVKSSSDPVRDFRESMVEMIWERGIGRRPEDLESLLACYLSLNSHEHHDVIVKVFCQVWFDLNREVHRVPIVVL